MPHSLNFSRWLQRLGFKDGREPEIIRAIQPVQVVGDASFLVSPTLPPSGISGGIIGAPAGVRATFEIYGGLRGGTLVSVTNHSSVISNYQVEEAAAALTLANLVTLNVHEFQAGRTCDFRLGTKAAASAVGEPAVRQVANTPTMPMTFYVGAGLFRYVVCQTVNTLSQTYCEWQEFEASSAAP